MWARVEAVKGLSSPIVCRESTNSASRARVEAVKGLSSIVIRRRSRNSTLMKEMLDQAAAVGGGA